MKRKLGGIEKALLYTDSHFPMNAVVVLRMVNGPSEAVLHRALSRLRERHPLLNARVVRERGNIYIDTQGTALPLLKVLSRQGTRHWKEIVEEEVNTPLDVHTGPALRLTLLTGSSETGEANASDLIITFMHLIMDAPSAGNLVHELLELCSLLLNGQDLPPLEVLSLMPAAESFFPAKYRGAGAVLQLIPFFLRQGADEILFKLRVLGKRKIPVFPSAKGKIFSMVFSKELSNELRKQSRKHLTTVNNLFNAAILKAVYNRRHDGRGTVMRNFNFADLRPYLVPSLDPCFMGSNFSMMRFTVKIKANPDTWELANRISRITYKSFNRGEKFLNNLVSPYLMRMFLRFKSSRMADTALSYTGSIPVNDQYGAIKVRDIHAFVSNFVIGPEYTAQVRLFDKRFYWDILYLDCDMDYQEAASVADEIRRILEDAVKEQVHE